VNIEVLSKDIGTFAEGVTKQRTVDLALLKKIVESTELKDLSEELEGQLKQAIEKAFKIVKTEMQMRIDLENLKKQFLRQTSSPDGAKIPKPAGEPKEKILMEQVHDRLSAEWDIITNKSGKQTVLNRVLHGTGLALVGYGVYKLGKWLFDKVRPKSTDSVYAKVLKFTGIAGIAAFVASRFGGTKEAKAGEKDTEKAAPSKLTKMPSAGTNLMQKTSIEYKRKKMDVQFLADGKGLRVGDMTYTLEPNDGLRLAYGVLYLGRSIEKTVITSAKWNGTTVVTDTELHWTKPTFNLFRTLPPTTGVDSKTVKAFAIPVTVLPTVLQNAVSGSKSFTVKGVIFTAS
jgi:hypothetical protein